jgi:ureidoacrylate peracid hydrolase
MQPLGVTGSALLVIDMQNGWCHPEGAMTRAGQDMSAQQSIVPKVKRLVQACRAAGLPILWSIQVHLPEDVTQERRRIASHLKKRAILPAPRGSWDAELVAPLKEVAAPEDHYIVKHRMSMFYSTTLEAVLRMLGVSHLVVSGVSTNVCVESTIRDAYFRDFDITVVEDCVAGSFPALHTATLENARIYFGEVVTLDQFIAAHEPAPGSLAANPK